MLKALKYYVLRTIFLLQTFCLGLLHVGARPIVMFKYLTGQVWNKNEGFSSSSTSDDVMNQFGDYLNNKTILVTGATNGIGRELILSLFRYWCKVYRSIDSSTDDKKEKEDDGDDTDTNTNTNVDKKKSNFAIKKIIITYRSKTKLKSLEKDIQDILDRELPDDNNNNSNNSTFKNNLMKEIWSPLECDLASLESIDKFVEKVVQLNVSIDILINNAGVLADLTVLSHTIQGFEMMFGVNYIAPFYMSILLHKLFKRSLENDECKDGIRVIHVSSIAFLFAPLFSGGIRFGTELTKDEIVDPNVSPFRPAVTHENYLGMQCYGESKLALILNAKELNRRYLKEGVNICCHVVHPGEILDSELYRSQGMLDRIKSMWPFTKTATQGAASVLYAALHPALNKPRHDEWIVDCKTEKLSSLGFARNSVLAEKLWKYTLKRIKEQYKPIPG